jgi:hypothetical protein
MDAEIRNEKLVNVCLRRELAHITVEVEMVGDEGFEPPTLSV